MEYEDIQQIIIIYGRKDLVEYFVEQFSIDRLHDGKEIKAMLVKDDLNQILKNHICKGDRK